jgi:hypothetical protein
VVFIHVFFSFDYTIGVPLKCALNFGWVLKMTPNCLSNIREVLEVTDILKKIIYVVFKIVIMIFSFVEKSKYPSKKMLGFS